jgi:hypothetical protein
MNDQSHLDQKYFIDEHVYNCPFCNRNNVEYSLEDLIAFDWSNEKRCYIYTSKCSSCGKRAMHLSYDDFTTMGDLGRNYPFYFKLVDASEDEIDENIFFSAPTSFFTIDTRVPSIIRECITEAEGCLKMNYLTGASACMRKAIYELCIKEEAEGEHYEEKIKSLKEKNPQSDPDLYDILSHIQDMASDKIHEASWDKWDSKSLKLIIETLKTVLYEIYVLPGERKQRSSKIQQLREKVFTKKDVKK